MSFSTELVIWKLCGFVQKETLVIKKISQIKKVLLTHKKGLLPYKQDLLTYTKKNLLTYTKNPRQTEIPTANSHGKFSRQNSQICNTQNGVEQFSVWESFMRKDKKKTSNKAKAMRINLSYKLQLEMIGPYCIFCINYPTTIQKRCLIWI